MCVLSACDAGSSFENDLPQTAQARQLLEKAVLLHKEHLAVADEGGQFVAHSNLGLCCGELRDFASAARHHQEALKLAIQLQVRQRATSGPRRLRLV
jgi:hypothetical protein